MSKDWPATARAIATATEDAVAAARAHSVEDYRSAVSALEAEDSSQVGLVHAEIIKALLEELHPDGLTGENVQDVLTRTVRSSEWADAVDVDGFVEVLTGALGVADTESPRPRPRVGHSVLVIADLMAARRAQDETVTPQLFVRRAIAEIERAQTIEMP
ncbi:MAG: hypothetical protein WBQ44_08115 [Rhodococcus sp. (in: high G+C Gram-positive bacteria)]